MVRGEILFGRNLNIIRCQNRLSQQELADAIHVTRQTISVWERGEGKPDIYCLHDICKYFNVSVDQMMYGKVINGSEFLMDIKEMTPVYETKFITQGYKKKGLYTIIDDDLENFFGIIEYTFEKIMVIALTLHHKGYIVTEVFDNGFSVCFQTDEEALNFDRVLYDILDCFIHHDNDFIEAKYAELLEVVATAKNEVLNKIFIEIYGTDISSFAYYWVDDMENPRGYANSEEECREQAIKQGCEKYIILPMA